MLPQISFLSPEEQEHIHQTALCLLSNVGIQMPSQEALGIMRKAGAKIEGKNIVKVPTELVAQAVETAPKRDGFVLYGREEKYDIHLDKDAPVLGTMTDAIYAIDLETRERRPCTTKDVADMVRLIDALENISINGALATPQDVPKDTADWYALAAAIKNTSKPTFAAVYGAEYVRDAVKMASLAVGGEEKFRERPYIIFVVLTRPPLQVARLSVEGLIEATRQGLPIVVSSGAILGMTAPVTMAGALAQSHAEVLSCLVLSQLVRPGARFMYCCPDRTFDMKNVNVSMASPEFGILAGASGQMGHYLGLPVWSLAMLHDAKVLDAQAGFETGIVGLLATLASDVIFGMQYDMDTSIDFADLPFSNEAMGALKRIASGFSIDENTLASNVIKEVGHGGSFLSSKHTLQNFKKEVWVPRLMERRDWPKWERDGKKDIEQRAREKAREILVGHQPWPLAPGAEEEIDRIACEATVEHSREI